MNFWIMKGLNAQFLIPVKSVQLAIMHIRTAHGNEVAMKMQINIPKGANIGKYRDAEIKDIENRINNYPRKLHE